MKRARLNHMMAFPGIALALVLVGCGGGGGDDVADMTPIMTPMPPTPSPVDATGSISLTAEQHAALLEVLPDNGDTVELDVDADGATRAGVTFTCMSAYPCTVTVTNSAGTLVATWASQTLGDGTASAMAMGLEPPVDTFAELNDGNTESIRSDVAGVGRRTVTRSRPTSPPRNSSEWASVAPAFSMRTRPGCEATSRRMGQPCIAGHGSSPRGGARPHDGHHDHRGHGRNRPER